MAYMYSCLTSAVLGETENAKAYLKDSNKVDFYHSRRNVFVLKINHTAFFRRIGS